LRFKLFLPDPQSLFVSLHLRKQAPDLASGRRSRRRGRVGETRSPRTQELPLPVNVG
jgi:hypothetical protein